MSDSKVGKVLIANRLRDYKVEVLDENPFSYELEVWVDGFPSYRVVYMKTMLLDHMISEELSILAIQYG